MVVVIGLGSFHQLVNLDQQLCSKSDLLDYVLLRPDLTRFVFSEESTRGADSNSVSIADELERAVVKSTEGENLRLRWVRNRSLLRCVRSLLINRPIS